jgi:nucleotide-binding universal stress UspA family protein
MTGLHSILVPLVNSPASLEAVALACMLAKQRKARVYVVHVIEVNRSLPLNAEMDTEARRGEQLLRRAEELAAAADYHVSGELLQAREAGQAIVDDARERGVDAIIVGVGYKRLIAAFEVGRTADYILKNAPCQVWVVRQAVGQPAVATHPA